MMILSLSLTCYRYRQTVIHNLPQLEKLDNVSISSQERVIEIKHILDRVSYLHSTLYITSNFFKVIGNTRLYDQGHGRLQNLMFY